MKHVHLTWYLLVDGTQADPNDVAPDADGVLRHENGLAVALHEDGTPCSIGVGSSENMNVQAASASDKAAQTVAEQAPAEAVVAADETNGDIVQTDAQSEAAAAIEETKPDEPAAVPADKQVATKEVTTAKPARRYKNREMKAR